jgi:hypothetical protein
MTTATTYTTITSNGCEASLLGFYFPEVCYLAESKRIKEKAQRNFGLWKTNCQQMLVQEGVVETMSSCFFDRTFFSMLPDSIGQCTKNVVKNTEKKMVTGGYNEVAVNDIMSRISGGLEEYAKLNASWKENKSRLLSGKRPAEKPDPMLVWVHDAVALEALEELASDSKEQIKSAWLKNANDFIAKCIETNFAPPHSQDEMELDALAKTYGSWDSWKRREKMREANDAFYQKVRVLFVKVTARTLRQSNHTPITAEQLEVLAQEYADGVWMDFIHKMGQKIGGLGITSLTTTTTIGTDHWESTLVCEARNGVTFNVNNSIVWKCNQYGTHFVQFPARFGDVKQNGIPVKNCADVSSVRSICDFKAFTK